SATRRNTLREAFRALAQGARLSALHRGICLALVVARQGLAWTVMAAYSSRAISDSLKEFASRPVPGKHGQHGLDPRDGTGTHRRPPGLGARTTVAPGARGEVTSPTRGCRFRLHPLARLRKTPFIEPEQNKNIIKRNGSQAAIGPRRAGGVKAGVPGALQHAAPEDSHQSRRRCCCANPAAEPPRPHRFRVPHDPVSAAHRYALLHAALRTGNSTGSRLRLRGNDSGAALAGTTAGPPSRERPERLRAKDAAAKSTTAPKINRQAPRPAITLPAGRASDASMRQPAPTPRQASPCR